MLSQNIEYRYSQQYKQECLAAYRAAQAAKVQPSEDNGVAALEARYAAHIAGWDAKRGPAPDRDTILAAVAAIPHAQAYVAPVTDHVYQPGVTSLSTYPRLDVPVIPKKPGVERCSIAAVYKGLDGYDMRGSSITKVDWITATWSLGDDTDKLYNDLMALCEDGGLQTFAREKGMHGYTQSAVIQYRGDLAAVSHNVGHIAWGGQGLLFELSGLGCSLTLKQHSDLAALIIHYRGRITRIDLALDLDAIYCNSRGITVPTLARDAFNGGLRSKYSPDHVDQSFDTKGDWSPILSGKVTIDQYDPEVHSPHGLSFYVGQKTSENQLVIYEKGKQLLGMTDKDSYVELTKKLSQASTDKQAQGLQSKLDKLAYNPEFESSKSWVRVERRIKRGGNKRDIPVQMIVDPDSAFTGGFAGLETLYRDYSAYVGLVYPSLQEYRSVGVARVEILLMSKRIFWMKRQYGHTVKTLLNEGLTAIEIVDFIGSSRGLKDYIFDISDDFLQLDQ